MSEKSIDIVVRGRDETKRGLDSAKKNVAGFNKQLLAIGAGVIGVDTGMKVLAATSMLMVAQGREQAALYREDLIGMLDAQKEANRGWAEMGRAVPLVGDAIGKMVEALGDTKHIEELKASLMEVRKETEKSEQLARQWARETALERARLRGAPPSEMTRIGETYTAKGRIEALTGQAEVRRKASQAVADQQARIAEKEAHLKAAEEAGIIPAGAGQVAPKEYETLRLLQREREKADDNYEALRKEAAEAAATAEMKVDAQVAEERRKNEEDAREAAQKRAEEERRAIEKRLTEEKHAAQERFRLAQEFVREERMLEAQRERARQAALQRQYAAEDAMLRDREALEDTIFAAKHTAEQVRIRAIEKRYADMASKYDPLLRPQTAADREMLALIEAARAAELSGIGKPEAGFKATDVAAFSARFLTHVPGRTADPEWTKELKSQGKEEIDILRRIADKLDVNIGGMTWQ